MKKIPLTQGKVALVSDHWFDYLNQWKWFAKACPNGKYYAARMEGWPHRKMILMHRVITRAADDMQVDHRDNDGLNNQDENLRNCTHSQNMRNRTKLVNNTSGYKGVIRYKSGWKWQLKKNGKRIYSNMFLTVEEAARGYDQAALEHHGSFAVLNFPLKAE